MKVIQLPADLGTVTPMTAQEVCDWILHSDRISGRPRILGNVNLHALYLTLEDGPVRRLTEASDVVLIDGWPILQLARFASPSTRLPAHKRIGSTDWLSELIDRDPKMSVVSVGGTTATAEGMTAFVRQRARNLQWRAFDGYGFEERSLGPGEPIDLAAALAVADLVLVGLGMPRQEAWILDNLHDVKDGAVVANVGGCLDYFAGTQRLAPRWMGRLGLEWLFRLINSPRRLAGRYLLEPILLLSRILRPRTRQSLMAQESTSDA